LKMHLNFILSENSVRPKRHCNPCIILIIWEGVG